jgi:hypothetical protein
MLLRHPSRGSSLRCIPPSAVCSRLYLGLCASRVVGCSLTDYAIGGVCCHHHLGAFVQPCMMLVRLRLIVQPACACVAGVLDDRMRIKFCRFVVKRQHWAHVGCSMSSSIRIARHAPIAAPLVRQNVARLVIGFGFGTLLCVLLWWSLERVVVAPSTTRTSTVSTTAPRCEATWEFVEYRSSEFELLWERNAANRDWAITPCKHR